MIFMCIPGLFDLQLGSTEIQNFICTSLSHGITKRLLSGMGEIVCLDSEYAYCEK